MRLDVKLDVDRSKECGVPAGVDTRQLVVVGTPVKVQTIKQ